MQIRLFHLQNSRSQRIVWFLEELGLPYELVINHHSNV
ncbi:MAG: glutathione S-transferase, partial [Acinetobacter sp.]